MVDSEGRRSVGNTSARPPRMAPTRSNKPTVGSLSPLPTSARPVPTLIKMSATMPSAQAVDRSWFDSGTSVRLSRNQPGAAFLHSAAMPIDIDIAHVARLARLDLSEQELESYKSQLAVILEHAALVQGLDAEPNVENPHALGLENRFRPDERRSSLDHDEVMSQAPAAVDGYFEVPPALEGE